MAHPQVAHGRDGLLIWRIAAIILNRQSQTADSSWFSILGVGHGELPPHLKKLAYFEMLQGLGFEQILYL
jgi:hypothetical protein